MVLGEQEEEGAVVVPLLFLTLEDFFWVAALPLLGPLGATGNVDELGTVV